MTPARPLRPVRVVVVDDSAFARKVMREVLTGDPRIEVVAIARDGLDALEKITETSPDVVTLDLVMPQLDGVGVLDAIRMLPNPPRVVVVTMSDADSVLGVAALQAGAFDVVHKPTALATDRLYELGKELVEKVILAAGARFGAHLAPSGGAGAGESAAAASPGPLRRATRTKMLVVGASTGGPRAITVLLRALPADFPVPVAIVVHMPPGYTDAFANRLDKECALDVVEASDGLMMRPGLVVIARAGIHLKLRASGDGICAALDVQPMDSLHRPSVDALFSSAAAIYGSAALGVILTGMGNDGVEGSRAIHAAGGRIIVEDASTCVVYGMPRAVTEQGLAEAQVPLPDVAAGILARL
jgi:two-component system chemotaxis response regulator CheB